ncbi:hypothetical protein B0H14DRAFT_3452448 [Mycena olivaceomarginata]|nr:hypothetical protein B0H14DRAFT_3452448 [Mycena olivaceomarginata]
MFPLPTAPLLRLSELGKVKNAAKKVATTIEKAFDRPQRKKSRTSKAQATFEDGDEELAFLGSAPTQEKSDTGHGSSGNKHDESDNEEGNTDNDHDNDNTTDAPQSVGTPSVQEFTEEEKLDEMKKKWTSPIYAFFSDIKIGQEDDGRRYHFFKCAAVKCKGILWKPGAPR